MVWEPGGTGTQRPRVQDPGPRLESTLRQTCPSGPHRPRPSSTQVPWRQGGGAPRVQPDGGTSEDHGGHRGAEHRCTRPGTPGPCRSLHLAGPWVPPTPSPGDPGAAHGLATPLGAPGHVHEGARETGDQKVGSGHPGVHAHVHTCEDPWAALSSLDTGLSLLGWNPISTPRSGRSPKATAGTSCKTPQAFPKGTATTCGSMAVG